MNFTHLIVWLKRMLWLLVIYFIIRILFFLFNLKSFQSDGVLDIGLSFLIGLKFDLSAIVISNILFTILSLLPFNFVSKRVYQLVVKYIYWIPNIILFWPNIADFEYYKFIGRRTIFEIFGIVGDIGQQAGSLLGSYWYLVVIWIVLSLAFIKGTPNVRRRGRGARFSSGYQIEGMKEMWIRVGIWVLSIGLTIIIFRGGFQEKPLRINQAFVQHDTHLGNLALNTTFSFLTTIDAVGTEKVSYFAERVGDVAKHIKRDRKSNIESTVIPTLGKQNVVIIILESFAREYMGYKNPYKGYTPFLDSLSKSGVFFNNCFSNGRESIIAVPAITSAIPQLIEEPFITSSYQSNKFIGLGSIVKNYGYASSFFHGARNGSMGFVGFTELAGFDKYFGLNQYPSKLKGKDFDDNWGIYDGPYLQYFAGELSKEKAPFVSCVFTLSSHNPYAIPKEYAGKFSKGKTAIHESIGYTDFALKQFFETASKQPWFKNTLFVITADHTQMNTEPSYASAIGAYRVPLVLYHPDSKVMKALESISNNDKICQHADILPTVLDFLDIPQGQVLPFGESILAKNEGLALQYDPGNFRMITSKKYIEMDLEGKGKLFDTQTNKLLEANSDTTLREKLKAFVQFYRNGLIENDWVN